MTGDTLTRWHDSCDWLLASELEIARIAEWREIETDVFGVRQELGIQYFDNADLPSVEILISLGCHEASQPDFAPLCATAVRSCSRQASSKGAWQTRWRGGVI